MMNLDRAKDLLLLVSLGTCVFLVGRLTAPAAGSGEQSAFLTAEPLLAAPVSPRPVAIPQGRTTKRGSKLGIGDGPLVYESGGGASSSANGFLAVTGSYGVGTSVLYLVDTQKRQLAVYEARGGSQNSRRLTLVGARRIDLDLQLEGYNDESEFTYGALLEKFESVPSAVSTPSTTEPPVGDGKKKIR